MKMNVISEAEIFALEFCLAGDIPDNKSYLEILSALENKEDVDYGSWELLEDLNFEQLRDMIDNLKDAADRLLSLANKKIGKREKTVVINVKGGSAFYYHCPEHIDLHIVDYDLLGDDVAENLTKELTNFEIA